MATKRPAPPPLAYVLRTATMRTEYKGAHAEGLELLFVALPDALARRKMIDRLEKAHGKLLAKESTGDADADVDQQTAAQVAALAHQVHPNMAKPPIPACTCAPAPHERGTFQHGPICPAYRKGAAK